MYYFGKREGLKKIAIYEFPWILSTNGLISTMNITYSKDTISTVKPKPFKYDISWFTKGLNSSEEAKPL